MLLHKCDLSGLQGANEMPLDFTEQAAFDAVPESLLSVLSQDQLSGVNNRRDVFVRSSLRYGHERDRIPGYASACRCRVDRGSDDYEP